jgi:dihydrofolate reductase
MNKLPKIVFSRTLNKVTWNNTKLLKGDLAKEVRAMKDGPGDDVMIFGSGTIVAQLARENLIDEYQLITVPVVLGKGKGLFDGPRSPADAEADQDARVQERQRARLLPAG